MDHPQRDVSREQQQNDQPEGSLSTPYTDETDAKPSTVEGQHQHPSYLEQEETDLKQTQLVQDLPAQKNEVMPTQQSQEIQKQEDHRKIAHQSQELAAHDNQEQQISIAGQADQSLSSSEQHQMKQFTQNQKQPQRLQPSDKDQQQRQQEQQIKKLKKKLVGENQERINFLVQASQAMGLTADSSGGVTGQRALAAQVGSLASAVGRRCVLRLAPSLKRCLCKGCGTALVYGLNARVRHRSRRQKHLVVTCLTCHTIKRFINDPKHRLWFEQEEALT
ncbi:putative mediator of RNA polymerase II transcription subunit 26 [Scylla paramamosain]|uniref:putative mediator of RNA polymerase II transcription subunit 26 n=1 Tax=Scylla paramamosain TaxID=85552 RepID=UPI003083E897